MRKTVVTDRTVAGALQTRSVGRLVIPQFYVPPTDDDESSAARRLLLYGTLESAIAPHTTCTTYATL